MLIPWLREQDLVRSYFGILGLAYLPSFCLGDGGMLALQCRRCPKASEKLVRIYDFDGKPYVLVHL